MSRKKYCSTEEEIIFARIHEFQIFYFPNVLDKCFCMQ
jgi:hypothetical protein